MFDRDDAKRFGLLLLLIFIFLSSCITIVKVIDSSDTDVQITKGKADLETQPLINITNDTTK